MSGLFGSSAQNNTSGGGLFGSNQNATGSGLFGSTNNQSTQNTTGGGLFGSTNNQNTQNATGGGLFGSANNQNTQNANSGGLFGNSANAAQPTVGGGLFGSNNNNQANTTGGLFGASNQINNPSSGLFGANNTNGQNANGGLFGGGQNTNQNNNNAASLFGGNGTNNNVQNTSSLFGNQATPAAGSALGGTNNQASSSLFGQPNQSLFGNTAHQQPQNQQQPNASAYSIPQISVGPGDHTLQQSQLQRLQYSGVSTIPNEKTIPDQIKTIVGKWNPDPAQGDTILKTYLYNSVDKAYAPFFYPDQSRGEDEKSWEEALSNKPEMPKVEGSDGPGMAYVPILCRGFKALGERVETQARFVQEMRARLHEMNNSLNAVMDIHQQRITTKIVTARRQHQILSQRCLRLAVKVQTLRNRGYALDSAEEGLRKTLLGLEKQVMDAGFASREDEVWARMVALRERARWLQEESKRLSSKLENSVTGNGTVDGSANTEVSEPVQAQIRKILKDYHGQLEHLGRELQEIVREFGQWEASKAK